MKRSPASSELSCALSRRDLLRIGGTGLVSLGSSGAWLSRANAALPYGASSARAGQAPARLVVIMLRGAVDGLSIVVPWTDPQYYALRPGIGIARPGEAEGLLPLDKYFGLHPALARLMPYWQRAQMGFVQASGSPDATRSHFDAQDYMESATPGRKSTQDGWMNRLAASLLSGAGAEASRLQAVNLGPVMPRIFSGSAPVASLATGAAATGQSVLDRPQVAEAFASLYGDQDKLSQAYREGTQTRREIRERLASDDPKADAGALPLRGLAADTARLGQLIARDAHVRLAFVPVGGWDTHVNQGNGKGQLAIRLGLLAEAIDALITGMGDQFQHTTVLVMSEFGRTVRQNGTGGTDHGHGNVMWALGAGVQGGRIHGVWPGLDAAALYEGRDLAITTDFRAVIASVLERRFRLDDRALAAVLPDYKGSSLQGLIV